MRSNFLQGHLLWNFAVYVQSEPFTLETRLSQPVKLFNSRQIKLTANHPRDQADPFMVERNGSLYIFYEKLLSRGVGKIACCRTHDLRSFEDLGIILEEPHHLSYPFLVKDKAELFMIPEARRSGEVPLYQFTGFPSGLTKVRALITGSYCDPFVTKKDGLWYLFATSERGLEIFYSEDLRKDEFKPHALNPVVIDPKYSRSGGGPLQLGNSLIRVGQDCSGDYGSNISLIEVACLSAERYEEKVLVTDFFERRDSWNKLGAHHLCVGSFRGKTVILADGKNRDLLVNKVFSKILW